jgi:hypothetical protein
LCGDRYNVVSSDDDGTADKVYEYIEHIAVTNNGSSFENESTSNVPNQPTYNHVNQSVTAIYP